MLGLETLVYVDAESSSENVHITMIAPDFDQQRKQHRIANVIPRITKKPNVNKTRNDATSIGHPFTASFDLRLCSKSDGSRLSVPTAHDPKLKSCWIDAEVARCLGLKFRPTEGPAMVVFSQGWRLVSTGYYVKLSWPINGLTNEKRRDEFFVVENAPFKLLVGSNPGQARTDH